MFKANRTVLSWAFLDGSLPGRWWRYCAQLLTYKATLTTCTLERKYKTPRTKEIFSSLSKIGILAQCNESTSLSWYNFELTQVYVTVGKKGN